METNLKVKKGVSLWVFKHEGKFAGCFGIKNPITAQELLDSCHKIVPRRPKSSQNGI